VEVLYRLLNKILKKDVYAIPIIQEIFDSLKEAFLFSILLIYLVGIIRYLCMKETRNLLRLQQNLEIITLKLYYLD